MMRKIQKELKNLNKSKVADLIFLVKMAFNKIEWPLRFNEGVMKKASKLARANARTIMRLMFLGMLLYGQKMSNKEFLLRRITTLSVYMFGLLAVLAEMSANGRSGNPGREDLDALSYFLEEAKEARQENKRLFDSRKESLHSRIMRHLFPAQSRS